MPKACLVALLLCLAVNARADRYRGTVVRVDDGDTLAVNVGNGEPRVVRLYGIDSPEGDQPFSQEARDFAAQKCMGAEVAVQVKEVDRADRLVSVVVLPDGSDLALAIVEAGLAWCEPAAGRASELFQGAQTIARRERRGLWVDPGAIPPWRWRGSRATAAKATEGAALCGVVVTVSDGDCLTLRTEDGKEHVVRLYGVDAPERGRPFTEAARTFVAERCLEKQVTVSVVQARDGHGRTVGRVVLPDGNDLGLALTEAGLAWWERVLAPGDALLEGAEQDARTAKRGLWQDDNPKAPWAK